MEKRRQNHSCEQCRRSKKACDGFFINNRSPSSQGSIQSSSQGSLAGVAQHVSTHGGHPSEIFPALLS